MYIGAQAWKNMKPAAQKRLMVVMCLGLKRLRNQPNGTARRTLASWDAPPRKPSCKPVSPNSSRMLGSIRPRLDRKTKLQRWGSIQELSTTHRYRG